MKRDRDRGKAADACFGKEKIWAEPDAGMDELFAVLGYKVKSSDMADVAEKLEQLEMAMGSTMEVDGAAAAGSVLSTDTVHYNPSDLSGWVESMLSGLEMNPSSNGVIPAESSSSNLIGFSKDDDDLGAIPRGAILSNRVKNELEDDDLVNQKRMKPSSGSDQFIERPPSTAAESAAGRPVVLLDSQETGVRLVHTLMACAEAIQQNNMKLADALLKHIGILAVSQVGAMRKVATYFTEALARKIYKIYPQDSLESSYSDVLHMHFFESAPYLKFAHFTSNQAIFEAFNGSTRVHVIDFSLKQGMQWPALFQALACRPGGPPAIRLTGIGLHQAENKNGLQEVGGKLQQLAEAIGIKFEFRGITVNSLADIDPDAIGIRKEETLAVNSVFELHGLLAKAGAMEKVLTTIKGMRPKIVTIVEQEANHNGNVFLDRFNEALHFYSTMFDSVESAGLGEASGEDLVMTEVYLGKQICNVLACEGEERVERHETLAQWRSRMQAAGFEALHLGSNAYKQVSMLLALSASGDGYRVEENDGCLMLGWHTRPLIATSAWRLAAG